MPPRGLSHKEIAARLQADGELAGWWAQMLTVAFGRHIGRRVPGQEWIGCG